MHQIQFLLGLRPRPRWGSLQCPTPMPLLKGPTSKGMEENGRGGRKGKGEGSGEVKGGIWPTQKFWCGAPYVLLNTAYFTDAGFVSSSPNRLLIYCVSLS